MQHASLTVMTLMYLVFISRFWQNLHCGLLHFISVRSLHADTNFCCHSSVYGLSSSARTALTCADLPVCAGWTAAGWTAAGWTAADWTAAGWCAAGSTAAPERISAISAGAASSRACVSTWESSQHTAEQAQSKRYRGIFRLHCWIIRRGNLYTEIQRATGPEGDLRRTPSAYPSLPHYGEALFFGPCSLLGSVYHQDCAVGRASACRTPPRTQLLPSCEKQVTVTRRL